VELDKPRIEPVTEDEYARLRRELFGTAELTRHGRPANVGRTWARHPELVRAQRPLQRHFGPESTLSTRDTELVILRIAWLCQSAYEFGQHVITARTAGLTTAEIAAVKTGPTAATWGPVEAALLQAVDEMYSPSHQIADSTWRTLAAAYSVPQLIDIVALTGRYWGIAVALKSFGVQREDYNPGFDESAGDPEPSDATGSKE